MIKQPTLIRALIVQQLTQLRVRISTLPEHERDAMLALEGPQGMENMLHIANLIMEKFGASLSQPKQPRFDKMRRALAKQTPKGPRGGHGVEA